MTRVVQLATGTTGRLALRAVIDATDLDLVGVRVYDPEKVGLDAGDLVDRQPTGVTTTDSKEAILAIEPDVVLYEPSWSEGGEGYHIEFGGAPSLRCGLVLGIHGEDHTEIGCLATAMHAIHAIPSVRAAGPGVLVLADVADFVGDLT